MGNPIIHTGTAVTAPTVRPGATRPGEVRYFRMPDGSISTRRLEAPGDDGNVWGASISAPRGGVEIEAGEALDVLAAMRQAEADRKAAVRAEAAGKRAATHAALIGLGLPAEAASTLTGHYPASTE